ncbi:MAG TPA: oxygen-dependent coproporphyrinogen oxidase [Candidatus Eisenbacteria bacterium]|nr:oxygen-dependent coproporphyrinogen oxidase [Candidatus Eisenbacteria bacterium]
MTLDTRSVGEYLEALQNNICALLESHEPQARFTEDSREDPESGLSRPRVLSSGRVFERAAANFTHARGGALPPAASVRHPDLAGEPFQAVSLSVIVHPQNPYVPTTHLNLRFFSAGESWWFGGGMDLTPFYGFEEDVRHWHRVARDACRPFGEEVYPRMKRWCDDYFFLKHRGEPRGVGGVFFDDFAEWPFEMTFAFVRSVGDHFLTAYLPIVERRKDHPFGEREREFQLYRRGRYVEFNLIQDRGTLYGLQSGRRVEAVLSSLPPHATWDYGWHPVPGSSEAELYEIFLKPRDWLGNEP